MSTDNTPSSENVNVIQEVSHQENVQEEGSQNTHTHKMLKTALIAGILGAVLAVVGVLALLPVLAPPQLPHQAQLMLDSITQRVSTLEKHPRLTTPLAQSVLQTPPDLTQDVTTLKERVVKFDDQINALMSKLASLSASTTPSTPIEAGSSAGQSAGQSEGSKSETPFTKSMIHALFLGYVSHKIDQNQSIAEAIQLLASNEQLKIPATLIADLERYQAFHAQVQDGINAITLALKAETSEGQATQDKAMQDKLASAPETSHMWGGLIKISQQSNTTQKMPSHNAVQNVFIESLIDALKTHQLSKALQTWQMLPASRRDTLSQNTQIKALIMHVENRVALINALDQRQREALRLALQFSPITRQ